MSCVNDEYGGGGAEGNMIQEIHVRPGSNYAQKNEWMGEAKTQEKATDSTGDEQEAKAINWRKGYGNQCFQVFC